MRRRTKSSYRMLNETCAIGRAVWKSAVLTLMGLQALGTEAFRPPAVPLVACDPYFSIWSPADKLTDADTVHWTGKPHHLTSLVRIGEKVFRLMGKEPSGVPALPQVDLEIQPTRTIYTFAGEGIRLTLTFMTPALPDDLMVYSRPLTYVTYDVVSTDGMERPVDVIFSAAPRIAVNEAKQRVVWELPTPGKKLVTGMVGSEEQPIL